MDDLKRQQSRRQYLQKRVDKKIRFLEEEIEYAKIIEEQDTKHLELILDAVKDKEQLEQDLDFEQSQLKRMGQRVLKSFKHPQETLETFEKQSLPINYHEESIIELIRNNQVSIIVAETGSGKTTQLPQMLYRHGFMSSQQKLVCTQPRRVAAMSVACRVAEEMSQPVGGHNGLKKGIVGYSVRFDDQTAPNTIIKFVTDGMLLREFINTPDLADYSVVIIDEAHERTVSTDILLGLLKDLCRFRPDLRLIISSATMNAVKFSTFYNEAPVYKVPGRLFQVDRRFLSTPQLDYVYAAVQSCLDISQASKDCGDILVFLPGQEEIEMAGRVLREKARELQLDLLVCPLYAALPSSQQQAIFRATPYDCVKIVLATNIAETSITVDGIVHVVDCGMVKQKAFNPRTGIESLVITATSQASAEQRAGRAGRTRPGICYRLYTLDSFKNEMPMDAIPEMQRSNLASICLFMKALGIDDIVNFDFVDPPPPDLLSRSLCDLYRLGALDSIHGELTKIGLQMSEFPVDPPLARVLIASVEAKCVEAVIKIAALISLDMTLFHSKRNNGKDKEPKRSHPVVVPDHPFANANGDHFMLLSIFDAWIKNGKTEKWCQGINVNPIAMIQADNIRRQLMNIVQRLFPDYDFDTAQSNDDVDAIKQSFKVGYSNNIAILDRTGLSYTLAGGRIAFIHPSSCLHSIKPPRKLLFHDVLCTSKDFLRTIMIVD